ncbi:threonine/serine exporter family protein [Streptomyces albidoflavus]|uniref:threonine/serine ThrE exporter family protein n=1 Tax=Streptomyces albidoflavus TaxID=1886 RepID=UPI0034223F65
MPPRPGHSPDSSPATAWRGTPYEDVAFPPARVLDDEEALRVLRFALRLGREMFTAGAETSRIEATVLAVAAAQGMDRLTADTGARSLAVQYEPPGRTPLVLWQVLGSEDSRDLKRLAFVDTLALEITAGRTSVEEAGTRLDAQERRPRRPWWVGQAGGALLSSMLCVLASGTLRAALITPVLFLLASCVQEAVSRTPLPGFFATAARVAFLVAVVTVLLVTGVLTHAEAASTIAANMILLLPLFTIVSLTEDALTGFRAMAAARSVTLLAFFASLATGFAVVGFLLRAAEADARSTTILALPVAVTLLTSAVGALGNTLYMEGSGRFILPACAVAVLGGGVKAACLTLPDMPVALATGMATLAMSFAATVLAQHTTVPARALVVPGIAGGVLPGPDAYRSLLHWSLHIEGAGGYLASTLAQLAAIGIGTTLGSSLARPLKARSPAPDTAR